MSSEFFDKIKRFNDMYRMSNLDLPATAGQTLPSGEPFDLLGRFEQFQSILSEEFDEGLELAEKAAGNKNGSEYFQDDQGNDLPQRDGEIKFLTDIADWLGDIVVYCASEARRYGIPLPQVLDIIMESNFSKLGADGKPIYDERDKLLKGPGYWKPEPKIKELLQRLDASRNESVI